MCFYCLFIIAHDRRRILHFNVTRHPTSAWIVQQLREAFPYEPTTQFLILDHDSSTAPMCLNRRELLDHVIAINESHLKRLPPEGAPHTRTAQD